MPDVIQLLPESIANQIAAGEVIQRPASMVKELVENAVDAGSSSIKLIVKDAGKTLVQVIDNGCGMSETDARMSFERHATSKIRNSKDLFSIRTMGFRGEALASIAAIAQVELRTRRRIDELGTQIIIEASELKSHTACQCEVGTQISVKNLFYNVPARRNFLKSNTVEMRHIVDEFQRIALANPEIFFSLHHNGTEMFHLSAGNLRQRVVGLLGATYNKKLVPIEEDTDVIKISGFVGKPEFAKKVRGEQFFFVNKRFIKSNYLHHAVNAAFEGLMSNDSFPMYVIFLDIDPARIDVNVHPTKQEIKFDDERLIYNYLRVAIRHALAQHSVTPVLDFEASNPQLEQLLTPEVKPSLPKTEHFGSKLNNPLPPYQKISSPLEKSNLEHWQKLYDGLQGDSAKPNKTLTIDSEWTSENASDSFSSVQRDGNDENILQKNIFQIHKKYIISQIKSGLLVIDQKAAYERVLYEKYLKYLTQQQPVAQSSLFPKTVHFSASDAAVLSEMLASINQLGFDVQPFGNESFVIHALPAEWQHKHHNEQVVLEQLIYQYKQNIDIKLPLHERMALALAKQAAKMYETSLAYDEMRALIDQLFACELPQKSPSGKKCFITIGADELEEKFGGS